MDCYEVSYVAPKCPLTIKPVITPYVSIVLALAVARVVVLLVNDKITEPYRRWVQGCSGDDGWFTYLVNCPWCTGVWVAAPMTALTYIATGTPLGWSAILTFLAVAFVGSYLADRVS